jgi:hypothetical protein
VKHRAVHNFALSPSETFLYTGSFFFCGYLAINKACRAEQEHGFDGNLVEGRAGVAWCLVLKNLDHCTLIESGIQLRDRLVKSLQLRELCVRIVFS